MKGGQRRTEQISPAPSPQPSTNLLVHDPIAPVLLAPVLEPGLVVRVHFGLKHVVDASVALDASSLGVQRRKLTLGEDVEVRDYRKGRGKGGRGYCRGGTGKKRKVG